MFALFLTTTITCSQAHQIIKRIYSNFGLPLTVREELIQEIRQVIPSCPIVIKQDEPKSK
jgi:transposase